MTFHCETEEKIIGNVGAGQVLIYRLNSHKAFTREENEMYRDKTKKRSDLLELIKKNETQRVIDEKHLYSMNKDGVKKDNEKYQIAIFESDVVRLALKDRAEEIANYQLLDEIVYMTINHNDIMWQIIRDDIRIAGEEYVFYTATTGQVRNRVITLLKKSFYERHKNTLMVGLSIDQINNKGGMNVGKYLAYTALPLSSSVKPPREIDLDRCVVVNGLETLVSDKVKFIDIAKDGNGQHYVSDVPVDYMEKSIPIEHTDGAGMFLPGLLPSSCQIRGGFFKGAMFPFDFRLFAKEVADNYVITDAWGKEVDIVDKGIQYIFTTSQLKMWKMYDSWDSYKKAFKGNGVEITINSYANPPKEMSQFAYQYLQTLPHGCEVAGICEESKRDLINLHKDIDYLLKEIEHDDIEAVIGNKQPGVNVKANDNELIAAALRIYPKLIYDPYIKEKIQKVVRARRKAYMAGKIKVHGYYSYAAPDMYALCQFLFCGDNNPSGLVGKYKVYNKVYDGKGDVEHLLCLRSPHLSRYEYGKRDLEQDNRDECRKWFQYMETDTVVSCHDMLSKNLQMDWDGDEIFISADEELYKLAKDLPDTPLCYDMQVADKQLITKKAIYETLVKGFDNNVIGDSSNAITKLWNSPDTTATTPNLYDDAINVFCAYSNYAIDYPKTGKSLALGQYGELYKRLVTGEGESRFDGAEIKCPHFFRYAKGKKISQVAPPTDNVMDRITAHIGQGTGRLRYKFWDDAVVFNYRMLMNNEKNSMGKEKYKVDRYSTKYRKMYELLKIRKKGKEHLCKEIDEERKEKSTDIFEISLRFKAFHYWCVREIKEIFGDSSGMNVDLAVNYMIDLEYFNPEFATSSKDMLWKCFGDVLVKNIQQNVHNETKVTYNPRMAYVKGDKGDLKLDAKIKELEAQKEKNQGVDLLLGDMERINGLLWHKKNGEHYNNDRELLFALYCLYKCKMTNDRLTNEGYLRITKKRHNSVRGTERSKPVLNMNKIMGIAGVTAYRDSIKRFDQTDGIEVIETDKYFNIKIAVADNGSNPLFHVGNVYRSLVYLQAYDMGKEVYSCVMCGDQFIRKTNNQKTCGLKCGQILHKINMQKVKVI